MCDYECNLTESQRRELAKDKYVVQDIRDRILQGYDVHLYGSVAELGKDNEDNGCREDDDDDESFGEFLIGAYKTGNSDTVYFKFSDGSVLAV